MSEITVSDVIVFITEMAGENQRYKIIGEEKDKKAPTGKSTKEPLDERVYQIGLDKLLSDLTYSFNKNVKVSRNDDGVLIVADYDHWLKNFFQREVPDNFTRLEVLELLSARFKEIYNEQKKLAVDTFLREEAEAKS